MSPSQQFRPKGSRFKAVCEVIREEPAKWLVSGVGGFIGSHLLERLLTEKQTVVGLDNFETGKRENLDSVRSAVGEEAWARFTMIEGDITDAAVCRRACDGVEFVLHQAALGSVPRSIAAPERSHHVNVNGFVNMVLAARDAGVRRMVYASSSSVYGDGEVFPRVEPEIGRPLSPYAATKRINEVYADAFATSYQLSLVGLRYFNVFGPRQDPNGAYAAVIPRWVAQRMRGELCEIFGDGETSRDFCPVANVVQANMLGALINPDGKEIPGHEVYNVALGDQTTLKQLYFAIEALAHPADHPVLPVSKDFRAGDVRHSKANITRITKRLGYDAEVDFRQGLKTTVEWYRDNTAQ